MDNSVDKLESSLESKTKNGKMMEFLMFMGSFIIEVFLSAKDKIIDISQKPTFHESFFELCWFFTNVVIRVMLTVTILFCALFFALFFVLSIACLAMNYPVTSLVVVSIPGFLALVTYCIRKCNQHRIKNLKDE